MKNSLLWQISGDSIKTSYVLGTMHVKSEKAFGRIDQIENLISDCDIFMAEYHLDEVRFVQHPNDFLIPEGLALKDLLKEKKYQKIRNIVQKSFGLDLEQFEYYLPLLIVNIISEAILSKEYQLPLDMHLWQYAKAEGKILKGAETYSSQLEVLNRIKIDDQVKMLKTIAQSPDKFRKKILQMAEWYQDEAIHQMYKHGKKSLGKYKEVLLKARNKKISHSFVSNANIESVFMAVGAGHLAGADGILKTFKNIGLKINAIKK